MTRTFKEFTTRTYGPRRGPREKVKFLREQHADVRWKITRTCSPRTSPRALAQPKFNKKLRARRRRRRQSIEDGCTEIKDGCTRIKDGFWRINEGWCYNIKEEEIIRIRGDFLGRFPAARVTLWTDFQQLLGLILFGRFPYSKITLFVLLSVLNSCTFHHSCCVNNLLHQSILFLQKSCLVVAKFLYQFRA